MLHFLVNRPTLNFPVQEVADSAGLGVQLHRLLQALPTPALLPKHLLHFGFLTLASKHQLSVWFYLAARIFFWKKKNMKQQLNRRKVFSKMIKKMGTWSTYEEFQFAPEFFIRAQMLMLMLHVWYLNSCYSFFLAFKKFQQNKQNNCGTSIVFVLNLKLMFSA